MQGSWHAYRNLFTTVIISNSVTTIGNAAFNDCTRLTSVIIPNSVTTIGTWAFQNCTGLTSVIIPNSVISIGAGAFQNCTGLTSITIDAETPPTLENRAFENVPTNIPIYILCLTHSRYRNAFGWNMFTNYIVNGNTSDTTHLHVTICHGTFYSDVNFPLNNTAFSGDTIGTGMGLRPGVHFATLANEHNCDSVIRLTISEFPFVPTTDYSAFFCPGGTFSDHNFTNLTTPGQHLVTFKNVNGCDSIVRIQLQTFVPPVQELCMISVDGEYHNEIFWKRLDEVESYKIYRETMVTGQYELVATIPYDVPNRWIDTASNARVRSFRYRISAVDLCGNESEVSLSHRTMHLTINQGVGNSWNLIWTAYEGTDYSTYHIYRRQTADSPMEMVGSMPRGNTTFSDFGVTAGNVWYMVEIVLNNPCEVSEASSAPPQNMATKSSQTFGSIRSNIATNASNETSIVEALHATSLQVYPNPVTNELHIVIPSEAKDLFENNAIELFDMNGRRVASTPLSHRSLSGVEGNVFTIDMSPFQPGNYILRIGNHTAKIVKQ
jgi:hypothetical protein